MNRTPHFGSRNRNPAVIGVAVIVVFLVIVLAVLFVIRKKQSAPHAPDVVAVIVSGSSDSEQQGDFEKLLEYAKNEGDVLVVASARHPDIAQSIPLAATGINNLERQQSQEKAEKIATQLYNHAVAPGGEVDLQQSFNNVYNILHTIHHARVWVAALGPMTDVADGVSLDNPLTRGDPAASISSFRGGFVSSCSGWDLDVAEGNVQPSSLTEDQDREYWRRLMLNCGGQLTAWTINIDTFPSTQGVSAWNGAGRCGITFEIEGQTLFSTGKYQLRPGVNQTLGSIIARVKGTVMPHLYIGGYTDSQGPASYNQILSVHRAQAVANWFLSRGIHTSQVTVEGHGEEGAVASNGTEHGRQLNRRVEVTLTYSDCPQA